MVSPSHHHHHPKSPNSLHIFSTKSPSSSSSSSSSSSTMKLKSMIHNLIFSRIHRLLRSFSKATRSVFFEIVREYQFNSFKDSHLLAKRSSKNHNNKVLFDSFRLHYNWCSSSTPSSSSSSSHVLPIPSPVANGIAKAMKAQSRSHHDSITTSNPAPPGNKVVEKEEAEDLSSYLQWLEEKGHGNLEKEKEEEVEEEVNEIDRLADLFIASCHEKFRLEKIESYRRYQEMLARGV
ncbi:hypothetical protein Dimus_001910 [Dionaea muscipula]